MKSVLFSISFCLEILIKIMEAKYIAQLFLKKWREKFKNKIECPEILHSLKIIKWKQLFKILK